MLSRIYLQKTKLQLLLTKCLHRRMRASRKRWTQNKSDMNLIFCSILIMISLYSFVWFDNKTIKKKQSDLPIAFILINEEKSLKSSQTLKVITK